MGLLFIPGWLSSVQFAVWYLIQISPVFVITLCGSPYASKYSSLCLETCNWKTNSIHCGVFWLLTPRWSGKNFWTFRRRKFLQNIGSFYLLDMMQYPKYPAVNMIFRIVFWDVLPCKMRFQRCILPPSSGMSTVHIRRQFWTSYSLPWELEISHEYDSS
jgi:hypothetical protein